MSNYTRKVIFRLLLNARILNLDLNTVLLICVCYIPFDLVGKRAKDSVLEGV